MIQGISRARRLARRARSTVGRARDDLIMRVPRMPRGLKYQMLYAWRVAANWRYRQAYQATAHPSTETLQRVAQLHRDGFLVLPCFLSPVLVTQMREVLEAEVHAGERVQAINKLRNVPGMAFDLKPDWSTTDFYVHSPMTVSKLYLDFALHDAIREIADAYLGTFAGLYNLSVWRNPPNDLAPTGSFRWHRDPEGPFLLKAFLYMNDVDQDTTHFTFVQGSHTRDYWGWQTPTRLSDAEMEALVPRDRWMSLVGPAGTVLLADTNGFHRGTKGTKLRDMLTVTYTLAPPSDKANRPEVSRALLEGLNADQRRVLRFTVPR